MHGFSFEIGMASICRTTLLLGGIYGTAALSASVILKALPRLGEFVFPGLKPGKPLSNMAMLSVLKDMNYDECGEPRWVDPKSGRPITPHGLRATFRTWGEDAGFPRDLLEESLGRRIGTAVERAYRRTDSFDRRRALMQAMFLSHPPGVDHHHLSSSNSQLAMNDLPVEATLPRLGSRVRIPSPADRRLTISRRIPKLEGNSDG